MKQQLETVKRKIRALLARTTNNGASENEASTALEKAIKLMAEHNLCKHDIDDYKEDDKIAESVVVLKRKSITMRQVVASLCDCFSCFSYYVSGTKIVNIYGYEMDRQMVCYLSDVIFNALEVEIFKFKKSETYRKYLKYNGSLGILNDFIAGYCIRMQKRIVELFAKQKEEIIQSTGTDLICIKDKIVEKSFHKEHPDLGKGSTAKYGINEISTLGSQSAEKIQIHKGINEDSMLKLQVREAEKCL